MGKPFRDEVTYLSKSVLWASNQNIDLFRRVIQVNSARQLSVIGSGGSSTAAAFLAHLHETYYGNLSRAITPLEYISKQTHQASNKALAFISAEGKNKDILAAANHALSAQNSSFTLTLTIDNPLGNICNNTGLATVLAYDMPWTKDGYLATNSLIAMMIITARAYRAEGDDLKLLSDVDDHWITSRHQLLREKIYRQNLFSSDTVIILYGQVGRIAAIDLESKLAEASLAVSQICDYRQFAHGRHLQLKSTSPPLVIAFTSPRDKLLSTKTLEQFPSNVSVLEVELPASNDLAEILGTIDAILITEIIGSLRGVDPGQPEVTEYGRIIHNLDINDLILKDPHNKSPAIEYKLGNANTSTNTTLEVEGLEFCKKLEVAKFKSIVCDFDGTFCDTARRFEGIDSKLIPEFERLLSAGITIGFATGRGDSLHKDLRNRIKKSLWSNVILGLYSGSHISSLDSPSPTFSEPDPRFLDLVKWLESIGLLQLLVTTPKIECGQMGIRISNHSARTRTLAAIQYWISLTDKKGWRAFCSIHSIDILTENVGKAKVVNSIAHQTNSDPKSELLRIGDSGDFDGNDFELLNDGLSLSVCSVSPLPNSCWNFLPQDYHGQIGTLYYLSSLEVIDGKASFSKKFIEHAKKLINDNNSILEVKKR